MKNCSRHKKGLCDQINPQPFENFSKYEKTKDGLYPQCRECQKEGLRVFNTKLENKLRKKEYANKQENKIRAKESSLLFANKPENKIKEKERKGTPEYKMKHKNAALKREYGITLEQYNKILLEQNNCCDICKVNIFEYLEKYKKSFAVDHNHETRTD